MIESPGHVVATDETAKVAKTMSDDINAPPDPVLKAPGVSPQAPPSVSSPSDTTGEKKVSQRGQGQRGKARGKYKATPKSKAKPKTPAPTETPPGEMPHDKKEQMEKQAAEEMAVGFANILAGLFTLADPDAKAPDKKEAVSISLTDEEKKTIATFAQLTLEYSTWGKKLTGMGIEGIFIIVLAGIAGKRLSVISSRWAEIKVRLSGRFGKPKPPVKIDDVIKAFDGTEIKGKPDENKQHGLRLRSGETRPGKDHPVKSPD